MTKVREFRPRERSSRAGLVLAVVLSVVMLVGGGVLGTIASGSSQVSYRIRSGVLEVGSGSYLDGTRTFAMDKIREARVADLRGGYRTRGTGAPGLCTGQWFYRDLGAVWQATSCAPRGVVLYVQGEERPIVLSPPDPEGFVAIVKAGTDTEIVLPPGDTMLLKVVPGVAAIFLVLTTGLIVSVFLYGPRRMRYVVDGDRLEVRTIFSRRSWPVSSLHARAHTLKVTMRLFGTAFPGYYTGLYRADGANTRVFATDLKSGVLVEGPARVYVSPAEPEAFLSALRDAGGTVDAWS